MLDKEQWGQLLQSFLEEAKELIQHAEEALLNLDKDPTGEEEINSLFRSVHTLKGSAGLFALDSFVAIAHQMESLMMRVRDGELLLNSAMISALLHGIDILRQHIEELEQTGELTDQHDAHQHLLDQFSAFHATSPDPEGTDDSPPHDTEPVSSSGSATPMPWHISLRFAPNLFEFGFDPASFVRYLSKMGTITHTFIFDSELPCWNEFNPEQCYLGIEMELETTASKSDLESVFEFIADLSEIRIFPPDSKLDDYLDLIANLPNNQAQDRLGDILIACGLLTQKELMETLAKQQSFAPEIPAPPLGSVIIQEKQVPPQVVKAALDKQQQIREQRQQETAMLRIPAKKLDELINLVGELVIAAAGGENLAAQAGFAPLKESMSTINQRVEQIREIALRLRMVEIRETFMRFNRLVRDTSQELHKSIELTIEGAETELDKAVIEKLADPLTHLVRNALDHGIELPEDRAAAGKSETGHLCLTAQHESGHVVIEVKDDGRGLNPERIRQKGIERGLLAADDKSPNSTLFSLIFMPGFSTAETVSNLSGRGVGMDVVKRSIEQLRGSIELDSVQGQGCCVRIRLPLTLAIIDGFLISVDDVPFVLPLQSVTECLELTQPLPNNSAYSYMELRGKPLPLVHLRQHFATPTTQAPKRNNIVVVHHGKQQMGLIVDHLLGEQQIVIKPLGALFEHLPDISGSSILGSGQVALILDIAGLHQRVQRRLSAIYSPVLSERG